MPPPAKCHPGRTPSLAPPPSRRRCSNLSGTQVDTTRRRDGTAAVVQLTRIDRTTDEPVTFIATPTAAQELSRTSSHAVGVLVTRRRPFSRCTLVNGYSAHSRVTRCLQLPFDRHAMLIPLQFRPRYGNSTTHISK